MINYSQLIEDMDLDGKPSDHRIVVAMSGGVDSSVTAALLTST
jgi:tRNA-specific 2-thiouridylase